jgi:hypothetical protein
VGRELHYCRAQHLTCRIAAGSRVPGVCAYQCMTRSPPV